MHGNRHQRNAGAVRYQKPCDIRNSGIPEIDNHQLRQQHLDDHADREQDGVAQSDPLIGHLADGVRVRRRVELRPGEPTERPRGAVMQRSAQPDHADQGMRGRDGQRQQHQLETVVRQGGDEPGPGTRAHRNEKHQQASTG